ncbi:MAG: sulfotransferase [Caulobacteraceae bacterium]
MDAASAKLLMDAGTLRSAGRYAEAERAYNAVLGRYPDLAEAWYNLAFTQRMLGAPDQALASYQEALTRGARDPQEIHLNRAVIYADFLRDADSAERELRKALAIDPDYAPALLNLGNLHEDRGDRAAARACYERMVVLDEASARALARLANLSPADSVEDSLIGKLERAVQSAATPLSEKAEAAFALARALDGRGAYDSAFEAANRANALSRALAGNIAYDRNAVEQLVDLIITAFPGAASVKRAPRGDGSPSIFICGMFRSGSTLVEQVLAGHPRIRAGGELEFIPSLARRLSPFPEAASSLSDSQAGDLANAYSSQLQRLFPGHDLITDKRPDNFLYVGLIKRLFPDAKIVHTVRHPLDNVLSVYFLHLHQSMSYAFDPMDIAHYYKQCRRLMAHWRALYPDDIFDFDYDAFVAAPRTNATSLLNFLGLDWNHECLAIERRRNLVKTASVWQVREPLYARASGRWRSYQHQLSAVRSYLSEFLASED